MKKEVRIWSELEKAEELILEKLKRGELTGFCSVCSMEQPLNLEDKKAKCSVCGNEFDIKALIK